MNIFTSEIEMLRANNEALQKTLANLLWDYTEIERAFNTVTGAKWVRKSDHPQRTWVGLTDEDIDIAFDDTQEGGGFDDFARAIEAKLKENNHD